MYKNKAEDGSNNVYGRELKIIREGPPKKTSQKQLADTLQWAGLDVDKNAIQRIESGRRLATDIELKMTVDVLKVNYQDLLD